MKYLKKDLPDSKWSAALTNGIWLTFFTLASLALICIVFPAHTTALKIVVSFFIHNPFWAVIVSLVLIALMVLRYFRCVDYKAMSKKIEKKNTIIKNLIALYFWIVWFGILIYVYVMIRLFLYGKV